MMQPNSEHTDDKRALLEAADASRRFVILRGHSFAPSGFSPALFAEAVGILARTDSGKSAAFALRLSCSARTYAMMAQRSFGEICAE